MIYTFSVEFGVAFGAGVVVWLRGFDSPTSSNFKTDEQK